MRTAGLLAGFLLPSLAFAADTCPWLNAATAEGLLGVSLEGKLIRGSETTSCLFTSLSGSPKRSLNVKVTKGSDASFTECSSPPIALKAIGNEAWACSVASPDGQTTEAVYGRVRDQLFRVEIAADGVHAPRSRLREQARATALHVAGNLF